MNKINHFYIRYSEMYFQMLKMKIHKVGMHFNKESKKIDNNENVADSDKTDKTDETDKKDKMKTKANWKRVAGHWLPALAASPARPERVLFTRRQLTF